MLGPARGGGRCRVLVPHYEVCDYLHAQLLFRQELQGVCVAAAISAASPWLDRCCSLEATYWLRTNRVLLRSGCPGCAQGCLLCPEQSCSMACIQYLIH